jgi:anti-anti-sigma regulatory factor
MEEMGDEGMSVDEPGGRHIGPSSALGWLPGFARVLVASGDLDDDRSSHLGRLVAEQLARKPWQLVLELSRVTSVGTAFIDVLLEASATAGEADIALCLVAAPTSPVVTALAAADLVERFEIVTTLGEADLDHSVGAAVLEGSRRACARAQTTRTAAHEARERSRQLRGSRPHLTERPQQGLAGPSGRGEDSSCDGDT